MHPTLENPGGGRDEYGPYRLPCPLDLPDHHGPQGKANGSRAQQPGVVQVVGQSMQELQEGPTDGYAKHLCQHTHCRPDRVLLLRLIGINPKGAQFLSEQACSLFGCLSPLPCNFGLGEAQVS